METVSQFWSWFVENNKTYTFLDSVENETRERLLDDFLLKLHRFCEKIYFEIGGSSDEELELIITAEGDKKYFHKVEELINSAPELPGWTFIAFKPPMEGHFKSQWDDIELDTQDLWFLPLTKKINSDLGLRIYLRNYDLIENKKLLMTVLYKMLDTILGEKSFASDISYVDAGLQPDEPEKKGMYQILKLPAFIKWYKTKTTK